MILTFRGKEAEGLLVFLLHVPGHKRHAAEDVLPFDGLYVPDGHNRHVAEDELPFNGL